ncbi:MAG: hypothetical protein RLO17_19855 [Cyclobacteriaceae bacterium]
MNQLNILFRVDAGDKIGLGHFYRSINLANLCAQNGHKVFFTHKSSIFWNEVTNSFNYPHFSFEVEEEKTVILRLVNELRIDIYFVDSPSPIDPELIKRIRKRSMVVFYQNMSNLRHLCDIYFLPSLHQNSDFFSFFSESTIIYQGLQYFTFNQVINYLSPNEKVRSEVTNVAIAAGGSDPTNVLITLYNWLDYSLIPNLNITFYYGINYLHSKDIPLRLQGNIRFQEFNHLKIQENDLLINAFGVSTYEFMYLGIPILALGHNQSTAIAADYLANNYQAILSLGQFDTNTPDSFNKRLLEIINNYETRFNLVRNAKSLLDLEGPKRIVEILEKITK